MADNNRLKLQKLLEETKNPLALESAAQQLGAAEQARPGSYQQSDAVQKLYQQVTNKKNQRPGAYQQGSAVTQAQNALNALKGPGAYQQGSAVTQAQNALDALKGPGAYQSRYDAQIQDILNTINNRKEFSWDAQSDPMYRTYRDQYLRMGERAAADAAANAAALTGGYGSTYGQAVAQQASQNYLAELNSQMPQLMQMAYARHQDALANDYNRLAAMQGAEQMDYGKWRDLMGDYQTERDYLAGRYDAERAMDYGKWRDVMSDYQAERDYLSGRYDTEYSKDYGQYRDSVSDYEAQRDYLAGRYDAERAMDYGKWRDVVGDYQTERDYLSGRYDTEYSKDYGQYRDSVSDYEAQRDYLSGRYDTEYSKDYGQYRDSVSDYENELAYLYNKYGDMSADEYQKYANDVNLWMKDRDYYLKKWGLAQDQANWQTKWDYNTRETGSGGNGGRKKVASIVDELRAGEAIGAGTVLPGSTAGVIGAADTAKMAAGTTAAALAEIAKQVAQDEANKKKVPDILRKEGYIN